MEFVFVALLLVGAFGIQFANGWLSKNEFGLTNFLMLLPLLIVAQYFIAWGYHSGTIQSNFITAHVVWIAVIVIATLAVNYFFFHSVPSPLAGLALILSGAAAVLAVVGK